MLRVFIALGKQLPKNKAMIEDTEGVARLLAKYNCTMVQGGAKIGLMGVVASEFQKYSDEVVMIVPEVHKADLVGTTSKEHYIVEGESDRMRITIHTCDMMVVLPGGSGTLAELSYYNETCKSGEHSAKIVVVNTDGFYNKLFKFHKHQVKNGLMGEDGIKYQVIKSAKDLEPIIQQLIADKQARLQQEEIDKALVEEIIKDASKPMEIKKLPAIKTVKTTPKSRAKAEEEKTPKTEKKTKTNTDKKVASNKKEVSTKGKKAASKAKPAAKVEPKNDTVKPDKVEKTSTAGKKVATKKAEPKQAKANVVKKVETEKKEAVVVEKPKAKKETVKPTPAKKATKTSTSKAAKTAPADVKPVKKATTKKTETKPVAKKASEPNKLGKAKKPVAKKTTASKKSEKTAKPVAKKTTKK